MLQLRHLAFASSLLVAAPAAHAAAMAMPRQDTPIMKVVDRLSNPMPSQDVGPGGDQSTRPDGISPDRLPPSGEMVPQGDNGGDSPEVMRPDEMPQDGADAPRPPSGDKDNGQNALPRDEDDGN